MPSCIIVDIDGTLSDASHRLHYILDKPKNWPAFFDAMVDDPPHQYVIDLVRLLIANNELIFLVSGRPDSHENQTITWLNKHSMIWHGLSMRKVGDHRPDTVVKKEILNRIRIEGYNPRFAIDDRPEVVRMWRENDVPCLQVDAHRWYAPVDGHKQDPLEWLTWMQHQHAEPMYKECADEIKRLRR